MEMEFKLNVEECPSCKKKMMKKDNSGVFPFYYEDDQNNQMKRLGVVYISRAQIDDDYICIECELKGMSSFKCSLCEERKNSTEIKESFGDPPEHLCKTCYEVTPVKKWDLKIESLEEQHRWDFE